MALNNVGRTLLSVAFDFDFAFDLDLDLDCNLFRLNTDSELERKININHKVKSDGQECPSHMDRVPHPSFRALTFHFRESKSQWTYAVESHLSQRTRKMGHSASLLWRHHQHGTYTLITLLPRSQYLIRLMRSN